MRFCDAAFFMCRLSCRYSLSRRHVLGSREWLDMKVLSSVKSLRKACFVGERLEATAQRTPMSCDHKTPLKRTIRVAIAFSDVLSKAATYAPPLVHVATAT